MTKELRKACGGGYCSRELEIQENIHSVVIVDAPYCTPKGAGSAKSDPAGETQTPLPRKAEREGVKVKWMVVEEERVAGERWVGSAFCAAGGDPRKRKLGNGPVSSQGRANHLASPAPRVRTIPSGWVSTKRNKHSYDRPSFGLGRLGKGCGHGRSSYCLVIPAIPSTTWAFRPSDTVTTPAVVSLPEKPHSMVSRGSRVREHRGVSRRLISEIPTRGPGAFAPGSESNGGITRRSSVTSLHQLFSLGNVPTGTGIPATSGPYAIPTESPLTGLGALNTYLVYGSDREALQGPFSELATRESFSFIRESELEPSLAQESLNDSPIPSSIYVFGPVGTSGQMIAPTEFPLDNGAVRHPSHLGTVSNQLADLPTDYVEDIFSQCPVGTEGDQVEKVIQENGSLKEKGISVRSVFVPRDRMIPSNTNPNSTPDTPVPVTVTHTTSSTPSNEAASSNRKNENDENSENEFNPNSDKNDHHDHSTKNPDVTSDENLTVDSLLSDLMVTLDVDP